MLLCVDIVVKMWRAQRAEATNEAHSAAATAAAAPVSVFRGVLFPRSKVEVVQHTW